MVTDSQVKRLHKLKNGKGTKETQAAQAGMTAKTARKYIRAGKLPSQMKGERTWKTRKDPFEDVWPEIEQMLEVDDSLLATTVFDYLCREKPGEFQEGQLRTLQRKMKQWKAVKGPVKEVMFPQERHPGVQCQSDFTCMNSLNVQIANQPFEHMLYHFVLPYSNWEWGEICFSESLEALKSGVQTALWTLGGVPKEHRTDNLGAAITNLGDRKEFNARYQGVMDHYGLRPTRNYPGNSHENGDVEQSHYRLKQSIDQELRLRGSRNFKDRESYVQFLEDLMNRRNKCRSKRLDEELKVLRELPARRLEDFTQEKVRVTKHATISVRKNAYSVDSRLIGHQVGVRIYADHLEVWYGQQKVDQLPRLRGKGNHHINYRHIIDSLVKKPGAFANYKYREDLFPRFLFRLVYDWLVENRSDRADKEYLKVLDLAAKESEEKVDRACRELIKRGKPLTYKVIEAEMKKELPPETLSVEAPKTNLGAYDELLLGGNHAG